MSRVAHPSEKVAAVGAIYRALMDELDVPEIGTPTEVHVVLIEAATRIAMSTDTKDIGILGMVAPVPRPLTDGPDPGPAFDPDED